jgi:hypothetical protein
VKQSFVTVLFVCLSAVWSSQPLDAVTAPPSSYAAVVIGQIVRLSWIAPTGLVLGYRLEAGTGPGLANIVVFDISPMTGLTVAAPPGVYYTRIRALSFDGASAPSNEIIVVVGGLPPPPPPPGFGPGQFRVNIDIAPGRYYSVPVRGCYWERQRGFSGNLSDVIANEFVGFNAGQWIVDILPTDVAFETDADCGRWFTTPRRGAQPNLTPGVWLVGSQVAPGTYGTMAAYGCYWERLRDFTGNISGVIDNEFVSYAGPQYVTIAAGDVGFHTDDDCGTWVRVASDSLTSDDERSLPAPDEIEWRRALQRQTWRRPR